MKHYISLVLHKIFYLSGILILLTLSTTVYSQDSNDPCKDLPPHKNDFLLIEDLTIKLQQETNDLQNKIKDLNTSKIPILERLERDLKRIDEEIATIKAKQSKTTEDTQRLDYLTIDKQDTQDKIEESGGKSVAELKQELEQAQKDLSWSEAKHACLKSELTKMQSPEQSFKWSMSVIFAVLIGIVIVGFFVLASVDSIVRRAVFAGQVGLQFIALFSIVIAIILFGITGILEAKELAALLGSLAGYILGRYNAPKKDEGDTAADEGVENFKNQIDSISLSLANIILDSNSPTKKITATPMDEKNKAIKPPKGAFTPQWKSSDDDIATVNDTGVVTRKTAGVCNITAEYNGIVSANCVVTCN